MSLELDVHRTIEVSRGPNTDSEVVRVLPDSRVVILPSARQQSPGYVSIQVIDVTGYAFDACVAFPENVCTLIKNAIRLNELASHALDAKVVPGTRERLELQSILETLQQQLPRLNSDKGLFLLSTIAELKRIKTSIPPNF